MTPKQFELAKPGQYSSDTYQKEKNVDGIWWRYFTWHQSWICHIPMIGLVRVLDDDDTVGHREPFTLAYASESGETVFVDLYERHDRDQRSDFSEEGRLRDAAKKASLLRGIDVTKPPFKSWGVFEKPTDYPAGYVARLFHNESPTEACIMSTDYRVIEGHMLEMGLHRLSRMPGDEPQILEVWI